MIVSGVARVTHDIVEKEKMKKYMIVGLLAAVSINAFAEDFETYLVGDAGYIVVGNQLENEKIIVNVGGQGDFLQYVDETPEILQIYNNEEKTVKFLSIEDPMKYIKPGKCLVNIIPYATFLKIGTITGKEENWECSYRLFCGSEMNYGTPYAVELCGNISIK